VTRCKPHWERLRREVPAAHLVNDTAMCADCFGGKRLRPVESIGDATIDPFANMPNRTLRTREVARLIGVSTPLLHAWVKSKKIPTPRLILISHMKVFAWTADDVERARNFKRAREFGAPRSQAA
jgi:predicted DNA-binding transcriptional regulator AlpA